MKDSAVGPAGLFDPRRQERLLDGLEARLRDVERQRGELLAGHALQVEEEAVAREQTMAECRYRCATRRRQVLDEWDAAEEVLTHRYESDTIRLREELSERLAADRRAASDDAKAIESEADARRQAVIGRHDVVKRKPEIKRRASFARIAEALKPLQASLEACRALTLGRLDYLPQVPPPDNPWDEAGTAKPATLDDVFATIDRAGQGVDETIEALHAGTAARIVDGPSLVVGTVVLVVAWSVVAYFFGPDPPWLVIAAGVPVGGLLGFFAFLILMRPVKNQTRRHYPTAERWAVVAERAAAIGRKLATERCERERDEAERQRDRRLAEIRTWAQGQTRERVKRLADERDEAHREWREDAEQVAETFSREIAAVATQMRLRADETARAITQEIVDTEASLNQQREANETRRRDELTRLQRRVDDGIRRAIAHADAARNRLFRRHPDWASVIAGGGERAATVDALAIGSMSVVAKRNAAASEPGGTGQTEGRAIEADRDTVGAEEDAVRLELPVAVHRRVHSGVMISAPTERMTDAVNLAHQTLWRLLSSAPPGRARLTLIDPIGRGQHFTRFMDLADHDPALVGHRVWTTESQIEARLGELAHHVEDVLQTMLRDRYARVEDYNEVAGSMAEPYRAVAAIGVPDGLSRTAVRHLNALIESGQRCGVFTLLVHDLSRPWPDGERIKSDKLLSIRIDSDGAVRCDEGDRQWPKLVPAEGPPDELRGRLIERIGQDAVTAARVQIPLEAILPAADDLATGGNRDAGEGLSVPIGSQGANRVLAMELGEGVRQHVLIAGKTGSGKSTLLHATILAAASLYTPDELQLYLLDFKKGVEFKPYADGGLPHARVIGIESEREFGHSVLRRLDQELQERGEAFRAASAQDLLGYRRNSGEPMPRIVLLVDEFQELFVRDDRLAADCAMLLDRLVRQGRSFGMHVILSSQSLAGTQSLPRATLGQMAVRIALQCSESDAALILSDENTAARLISRPGEAIYNDAGGLIEGNRPFQVAWLGADRQSEMIRGIAARDRSRVSRLPPPVVFEGNRPCRWSPALADAAVGKPGVPIAASEGVEGAMPRRGLLGESVEIGPPVSVELTSDPGRNVLVVAPPESRGPVVASLLGTLMRGAVGAKVDYFDGHRAEDGPPLADWIRAAGIEVSTARPRDSESAMIELDGEVRRRLDAGTAGTPQFVVIDPLDRFRDLRQDEAFSFSLDATDAVGGGKSLQHVLREGPAVNIFSVVVCGAAETLTRWLPRSSLHDLELRVLGRLNASDSAALIDTPAAAELSAATMILYDDADGRVVKFRPCEIPDPAQVRAWLAGPGSSTYC